MDKNEILDFKQFCFDGKVVLKKKKCPPFYTKLDSYLKYLNRQERVRNHDKVRIQMLAEHGELRSFHTDKYPECRPSRLPKKETEEETN